MLVAFLLDMFPLLNLLSRRSFRCLRRSLTLSKRTLARGLLLLFLSWWPHESRVPLRSVLETVKLESAVSSPEEGLVLGNKIDPVGLYLLSEALIDSLFYGLVYGGVKTEVLAVRASNLDDGEALSERDVSR